jgi:hypothetical protein
MEYSTFIVNEFRNDVVDWQQNISQYAIWQEKQIARAENPKPKTFLEKFGQELAQYYFKEFLKSYHNDLVGAYHPSKDELEEFLAQLIITRTNKHHPARKLENFEKVARVFCQYFEFEFDAHLPKNYRQEDFSKQSLVKSVEDRHLAHKQKELDREQHAINTRSLNVADWAKQDAGNLAVHDFKAGYGLVGKGYVTAVTRYITRRNLTSTHDVKEYARLFYLNYTAAHEHFYQESLKGK